MPTVGTPALLLSYTTTDPEQQHFLYTGYCVAEFLQYCATAFLLYCATAFLLYCATAFLLSCRYHSTPSILNKSIPSILNNSTPSILCYSIPSILYVPQHSFYPKGTPALLLSYTTTDPEQQHSLYTGYCVAEFLQYCATACL